MLQVIEEPTREENTLDLLFTNEVSIITEEVNKSAIWDHNTIELNANNRIREEKLQHNYQEIDNTMRSLDFHAEEKNYLGLNN